jgi:hypothetical protein
MPEKPWRLQLLSAYKSRTEKLPNRLEVTTTLCRNMLSGALPGPAYSLNTPAHMKETKQTRIHARHKKGHKSLQRSPRSAYYNWQNLHSIKDAIRELLLRLTRTPSQLRGVILQHHPPFFSLNLGPWRSTEGLVLQAYVFSDATFLPRVRGRPPKNNCIDHDSAPNRKFIHHAIVAK